MNLIETKIMLLAAGGSTITKEFVDALDKALIEGEKSPVKLDANSIRFAEPVFQALSMLEKLQKNEKDTEEGEGESEDDSKDKKEDDSDDSKDQDEDTAVNANGFGYTLALKYRELVYFLVAMLIVMFGIIICMTICKRRGEDDGEGGKSRRKVEDKYVTDSGIVMEDVTARSGKKSKKEKMKAPKQLAPSDLSSDDTASVDEVERIKYEEEQRRQKESRRSARKAQKKMSE
jgi:hypothetical protein